MVPNEFFVLSTTLPAASKCYSLQVRTQLRAIYTSEFVPVTVVKYMPDLFVLSTTTNEHAM